jgi:hypothetical protein
MGSVSGCPWRSAALFTVPTWGCSAWRMGTLISSSTCAAAALRATREQACMSNWGSEVLVDGILWGRPGFTIVLMRHSMIDGCFPRGRGERYRRECITLKWLGANSGQCGDSALALWAAGKTEITRHALRRDDCLVSGIAGDFVALVVDRTLGAIPIGR